MLLRNVLQLCNQLLRCCTILGSPFLQDSSWQTPKCSADGSGA
jgi:hypothetical protein